MAHIAYAQSDGNYQKSELLFSNMMMRTCDNEDCQCLAFSIARAVNIGSDQSVDLRTKTGP